MTGRGSSSNPKLLNKAKNNDTNPRLDSKNRRAKMKDPIAGETEEVARGLVDVKKEGVDKEKPERLWGRNPKRNTACTMGKQYKQYCWVLVITT